MKKFIEKIKIKILVLNFFLMSNKNVIVAYVHIEYSRRIEGGWNPNPPVLGRGIENSVVLRGLTEVYLNLS